MVASKFGASGGTSLLSEVMRLCMYVGVGVGVGVGGCGVGEWNCVLIYMVGVTARGVRGRSTTFFLLWHQRARKSSHVASGVWVF